MNLKHESTWQLRFQMVSKASEIMPSQWNSPGTPALIVEGIQELGTALHETIELLLNIQKKFPAQGNSQ